MTWLTWRQFRAPAGIAVALLAVLALLLALTPHSGALSGCGGSVGCAVSAGTFLGLTHDHLLKYLSTVLVGLPALIGAFWGAPLLARELETGSYRLAWTQSVTRTRWLAVKIALIGLASVAVSGLLSLMLSLWSSHAENLGRFAPAMFDERGIAPLGDAAFGFALGLAAGVLIRRTVPAMAVTLVGYLAARVVVSNWVRPHFATPLTFTSGLGGGQSGPPLKFSPPAGAWVISSHAINKAGQVVSEDYSCRGGRIASAASNGCAANARAYLGSLRQVVTYQPLSRYWEFQVYDVAVFLGVALILVGFCFWWVRRRLT